MRNKLSTAICKDCDLPLKSKKELKEGYCRICLIPNTIMNLHIKRDRLTEKIIEEHSPLKFGYFDSLFSNSNNKINSPNSIHSANPRIKQSELTTWRES